MSPSLWKPAFMCRTVVSIAVESPFTVRRTRLFCRLGAHRRSAARVAELPVEALQVGLREWRGEVLDEVRRHLQRRPPLFWYASGSKVRLKVPLLPRLKAVSPRVVASDCLTETL